VARPKAADIVAGLGGADNISEVEGCITRLRTEVGFTLHRAEGDDVASGAPVVSFDVALVRAKGLSAVCPVVVLDSPASVSSATGRTTDAGASLFAYSTDG
jgi:phosphotransferase system IIA component